MLDEGELSQRGGFQQAAALNQSARATTSVPLSLPSLRFDSRLGDRAAEEWPVTARKNPAALVRHKHNEAAEKQCTSQTCRQWKPIGEFYRCTKARDGRQSRCKVCDDMRSTSRASSNGSRAGAERVSSTICGLCCNLAHRVDGMRCRGCGTKWQAEPRPELELRRYYDMRAHL